MKHGLMFLILGLLAACGSQKNTQVSAPDPLIGVWVTGWYEVTVGQKNNGEPLKQMERQSYEFFPDGTVKYEWQSDVPRTRRSRGYTYRFEGTYNVELPKEHSVSAQRNIDIVKAKEVVRYAAAEASLASGTYGLPEILPNKFYDITGLLYDGTRDEKLLKIESVIRVEGSVMYTGDTPALYFRDEYPTEREAYVLLNTPFHKH